MARILTVVIAVLASVVAIPDAVASQPVDPTEEVLVLLSDAQDANAVAEAAGATRPAVHGIGEAPDTMLVQATPVAQERLRADPRTEAVLTRGHTVEISMARSVAHVGSPVRWASGVNGAGRTIAVIDTGVASGFGGSLAGQACFVGDDPNTTLTVETGCGPDRTVAAAFSNHCFTARVCAGSETMDASAGRPCGTSSIPVTCQHGSAVAAVAGRRTTPAGVAPGSTIYPIQVQNGATEMVDLVDVARAIQHVAAMHDAGAFHFSAVNISLATVAVKTVPCDGASLNGDDGSAARVFFAAFAALRRRGIAPVVAAGNAGRSDRLAFPACLSNAVPVGASDLADRVAGFSNRAHGRTVFAPGTADATRPTGSADLTIPSAPGYRQNYSGTSFSAPHVAGAMAILDQRFPGKSMDEQLALVQRGCTLLNDGNRTYPRLDLGTVPETAYIHAAHQLFLGRLPAPHEVRPRCDAVRTGDRATLTKALATSDEWAGVEIRNLYRKILGRNPDARGYSYWLDRVREGHHIEELAVYFYGGSEYFSRVGGTNRRFVDRLYRDLLGRAPDAGGFAYWVGILDAGRLDRSGVAFNFYASIESRISRVTRLYRVVLRRNPDTTGLNYWAAQLPLVGDISLAMYLAASEEFYRRVT